jgi:hypothetical protein
MAPSDYDRSDKLDPLECFGDGMPAYLISVRTERGFDVKIVGDNGARQTMLGFPTREAAEAWIVEDQRRSQEDVEGRF